jgi:flagellar motor switch protein FliN/FliY
MADEITEDDELLGSGVLSQSELDALLAAASAETGGDGWTEPAAGLSEPDLDPAPAKDSAPAAAPIVDLPSFDLPGASTVFAEPETAGLSRVKDIPLEVTVELGRTRLLIRDILDLGAGSIIELDKIAGEPVELFANGLLVARGEVVVIDDNFGVRVTQIITAAERKMGKDADALAA